MSTTYGDIGAFAGGSASISASPPVTYAAGDKLVLCVAWGNSTDSAPATPAGWDLVANSSWVGGPGSWGVDLGSRGVIAFEKTAVASEVAVTVNNGGTGSDRTMGGFMVAITKTLTNWDTSAASGGSDTSSGTGYSVTAAADPGGLNGDTGILLNCWAPDTATISSPTLTWTGSGGGTLSSRGASASTQGNDHRISVYTKPISGTTSAAPNFAGTLSAAGGGSSVIIRIRDTNAATVVGATATATSLGLPGDLAASAKVTQTVVVPASKVGSTVSNYPMLLDLSLYGTSAWWAQCATDGANIRVTQGGAEIPVGIVTIDTTAKTGLVFVKANSLTTSVNTLTLDVLDATPTLRAVTHSLGRNAVWSDYDLMCVPAAGLINLVDGTALALTGTAGPWTPLTTKATSGTQGLTQDPATGNWYLITSTSIYKYDSSFSLLSSNTSARTGASIAGSNHMGSPCVKGGELYVPIETYPSGPYANQWVAVFDLSTLAYVRKYDISANAHESSSIAWCPDDSTFYITEYPSTGNSRLHKYNASFVYQGTLTLGTSIATKQGIAYLSTNTLLVSAQGTGLWTVTTAGVCTLQQAVSSFDAETEGCAVDSNGYPHVLGGSGNVYRFRPKTSREYAFGGQGVLAITLGTTRTAWTSGVSATLGWSPTNQGLLGYGSTAGGSTTRAVTLSRKTPDQFGIHNSTDSWLMDASSDTSPTGIGVRSRVHQTFNGTTDRKVWRNGVLRNTDLGTSQRPTGTDKTVLLGASTTGLSEPSTSVQDYAYLRNGVLSADWLAAEYESWESPATFYFVPIIGSTATATAAGNPGAVVTGGTPATVVGATATATAAGQAGTVTGASTTVGATATATATGLAGAATAASSIVGATATATAAAVAGVAAGAALLAGATATATAAGQAGSTAVGQVVAGVTGTATAQGEPGSPTAATTVTGTTATATAQGQPGSTAVGFLVTGVTGTATALALAGIVTAEATLAGLAAAANAEALVGIVSAGVLVVGETATATAVANPGESVGPRRDVTVHSVAERHRQVITIDERRRQIDMAERHRVVTFIERQT